MLVISLQNLVFLMSILLFLAALASARREKAAGAATPKRVPGARR